MVTLRCWTQRGRMAGEVTVRDGQVEPGGADDLALVVIARAALLGGTLEDAVADLDGWSNGYVRYVTGDEPVPAWKPGA